MGRKRWYVAAAATAIVGIGAVAATTGGPDNTSETAGDQIQSAELPMADDEAAEPEPETGIQGLVGSPEESTTSLWTTSLASTTASPTTASPTTASPTTAEPTTTTVTTVTTQTTPATTTTVPATTAVVTAAETTATTPGCHPAYVECIPYHPGDALNCGDLSSSVKPVHLHDASWDPYGSDGNDNDGLGCESG